MTVRRSVVAFASFLAIAGCDDAGAPPKLHTGVPDSTEVGNLTDAQAQALCRGYEDLANALVGADVQKRLGCVATGVVAAASGSTTCESTYSTCMKESKNTGVPIDLACDLAQGAEFPDCHATVGQLQACANALAADVDPLIDGLSCSVATDPDALEAYLATIENAADGSTIAECTALAADCPTVGELIDGAVSGN